MAIVPWRHLVSPRRLQTVPKQNTAAQKLESTHPGVFQRSYIRISCDVAEGCWSCILFVFGVVVAFWSNNKNKARKAYF